MIPYDGSVNTEIALRALARRVDYAQAEHDALVVVSDVWLADSAEEFTRVTNARRRNAALAGTLSHVPALRAWDDERTLSREAMDRMTPMFPNWTIKVEGLPGFSMVSSEILEKADRSNADVIAIGTRKPLADLANGYGAAALRVAKEAPCSVFLATDKAVNGSGVSPQSLPTRVALVLTGSISNEEVVQKVASRKWPDITEVRIIVSEANSSTPVEQTLRASGLNVLMFRPESDSTLALAQTVIDWNPDAVFAWGERTDRDGDHNLTDILLSAGYSVELSRKSYPRLKALRAAA